MKMKLPFVNTCFKEAWSVKFLIQGTAQQGKKSLDLDNSDPFVSKYYLNY